MQQIVNLVGVVLVGIIYWWFFAKKEAETMVVNNEVTIVVEGGYKPASITVQKGKPVTLKFLRKDPSSCLEEVVVPEFKVRQFLELNKTTEVKITPDKTGTFAFSCGMNMFHGKLIVV